MASPHKYLLLAMLICNSTNAELPANYIDLSATDKLDILWRQASNSPYPVDQLPTSPFTMANMSKVFSPSFLAVSFLHTGDEMPSGRLRLVHTYGSVCKIQLEIFPNSSYTGVFQSGGIGLLRFSLATQSNDTFMPGIAVKILIDGQRSQNFQMINGKKGQGKNRNFFLKPLRNIFSGSTDPLTMLEKAFQASIDLLPGSREDKPEDLTNLGLYEQASVTANGGNVSTVVAPYMITMTPNKEMGWSGDDWTDFRVKLAGIKEGSVIYMVSVKKTLDEDDEVIGRLITKSPVLASPYGDEKIFFNHARKPWKA